MTILEQLRLDQTNTGRLLEILHRKVAKLRGGEHPNFGLLAEAIDYMIRYADECHHSWEVALFQHFAGRSPELDAVMMSCETQHQQMLKSGAELAESLDCILHDAVIPMDQFTDRLEQFVAEQSEQLRLEEEVLVPALISVATTIDWQTLEKTLVRPEDPLFGDSQSTRYSLLCQQLLTNETEE